MAASKSLFSKCNLNKLSVNVQNININSAFFKILLNSLKGLHFLNILELGFSQTYFNEIASDVLRDLFFSLPLLTQFQAQFRSMKLKVQYIFIALIHLNQLENLFNLKLDFSDNLVSDEEINILGSTLTQVVNLNTLKIKLNDNNLGSTGFQALLQSLKKMNFLKDISLSLNNNSLGHWAGEYLAKFFASYSILSSLKLSFKNNPIKEGCEAIFLAIGNLIINQKLKLNFSKCGFKTQSNRLFTPLQQLQINSSGLLRSLSLDLSLNSGLGQELLRTIISETGKKFRFLEKIQLNFQGNKLNCEVFSQIICSVYKYFDYLRSVKLDMTNCGLSADHFQKLVFQLQRERDQSLIVSLDKLTQLTLNFTNNPSLDNSAFPSYLSFFISYIESNLFNFQLNLRESVISKARIETIGEILAKMNIFRQNPYQVQFFLSNSKIQYKVKINNKKFTKKPKLNKYIIKQILGYQKQSQQSQKQKELHQDQIEFDIGRESKIKDERRILQSESLDVPLNQASSLSNLSNINSNKNIPEVLGSEPTLTQSMSFSDNTRSQMRNNTLNLSFITLRHKRTESAILDFKNCVFQSQDILAEFLHSFAYNLCHKGTIQSLIIRFRFILFEDDESMQGASEIFSFLRNLPRDMEIEIQTDFTPPVLTQYWNVLSNLLEFQTFSLICLNTPIITFSQPEILKFYTSQVFSRKIKVDGKNVQIGFAANNISTSNNIQLQKEEIYSFLNAEQSQISQIIKFQEKISFPFEIFFEKILRFLTLKHLNQLCENNVLFSKLRVSHLFSIQHLFTLGSPEGSSTLNLIFQKSLETRLNFDLTAHILSQQRLSRFLTLDSIILLLEFIKLMKKSESKFHFTNFIKQITKLNLDNNIYLSTTSCKFNILRILDDFWIKYRPKVPPPTMHFPNTEQYQQTIHSYYSLIRQDIKEFDLSVLDDAYGDAILNLIQELTFLESLDVSRLNLGDKFCERLSNILSQDSLLYLKFIFIHENPRITNVGLQYLCVSLGSLYQRRRSEDATRISTQSQQKSRKTAFLDLGIAGMAFRQWNGYFDRHSKFCHQCLNDVCSDCHKPFDSHPQSSLTPCKKILPYHKVTCEQSQVINRDTPMQRMLQDPYFIMVLLCFLVYWPFIILKWIGGKISHALDSILYKCCQNQKKNRNEVLDLQGRELFLRKSKKQKCQEFIIGPQFEEVENLENFHYNSNLFSLEEQLKQKQMRYLFCLNTALLFILPIMLPLLFLERVNGDPGVNIISHILILIFNLYMIGWETFVMRKIIDIMNQNLKSHVKILPSFSLASYGFQLFFSFTQQFDIYLDVIFALSIYEENYYLGRFAVFSLGLFVFINFFHLLYNMVFQLLFNIKFNNQQSGMSMREVNQYSRVSYIVEISSIANMLDKFSTKDAVEINGYYVPQSMITSLTQLIVEDILQFSIQLQYTIDSGQVGVLFILNVLTTVLSLLSSIRLSIEAKSSNCTRAYLQEKYGIFSEKDSQNTVANNQKARKDTSPQGPQASSSTTRSVSKYSRFYQQKLGVSFTRDSFKSNLNNKKGDGLKTKETNINNKDNELQRNHTFKGEPITFTQKQNQEFFIEKFEDSKFDNQLLNGRFLNFSNKDLDEEGEEDDQKNYAEELRDSVFLNDADILKFRGTLNALEENSEGRNTISFNHHSYRDNNSNLDSMIFDEETNDYKKNIENLGNFGKLQYIRNSTNTIQKEPQMKMNSLFQVSQVYNAKQKFMKDQGIEKFRENQLENHEEEYQVQLYKTNQKESIEEVYTTANQSFIPQFSIKDLFRDPTDPNFSENQSNSVFQIFTAGQLNIEKLNSS